MEQLLDLRAELLVGVKLLRAGVLGWISRETPDFGSRMLSPAGDPAVLPPDRQRAADGAGRSQLLDDRRGGWASRAAPAAATHGAR
jgi:hypothetical protein